MNGFSALHDVGDGAVAVKIRMRRCGLFGFRQDGGIRLLHHLFAEIHAYQVVLKDVVVEHVLGSFAEIDDPLRQRRRPHAKCHVLRIGGAGGVIVATDPADAARDEVSVARILPLHENAIAAEDG